MQPVSRLALITGLALIGSGATAVGLGPLRKSGITDGPSKGFYLTLINPYRHAERFTVDALDALDESVAARVVVFPGDIRLAPNRSRQLLVIVKDLQPGERYSFRVCAHKPPRPEESVDARVCSTLMAHRLAVRPRGDGERTGRLPAPAA